MPDLMAHGRKFAASMIGIVCVMLLAMMGMVLSVFDSSVGPVAGGILPVAIGAIAGMVATFITGNSAVTFAYSKHQSTVADLTTEPNAYQDDERGAYPNREMP